MYSVRLRALKLMFLLLALIASATVNAGLFGFGGHSWKEEVLLHDGQKIIVKRSQSYGGRHEIGQSSPIKEHSITFTLPGSSKNLTWTSEFGEDVGMTYFSLLALHLLNGIPYIVAEPTNYLSCNKWGRPNPCYVFFKYNGKAWQRIPLAEFPAEFKNINVILSTKQEKEIEQLASKHGYISAEDVNELNRYHKDNRYYRSILREPMPNFNNACPEMIRTGDGGWSGIGFFETQPSAEACLKYCEREKVVAENCPCRRIFIDKPAWSDPEMEESWRYSQQLEDSARTAIGVFQDIDKTPEIFTKEQYKAIEGVWGVTWLKPSCNGIVEKVETLRDRDVGPLAHQITFRNGKRVRFNNGHWFTMTTCSKDMVYAIRRKDHTNFIINRYRASSEIVDVTKVALAPNKMPSTKDWQELLRVQFVTNDELIFELAQLEGYKTNVPPPAYRIATWRAKFNVGLTPTR